MKKKKIILFNGPPGSGKDTAAERVGDLVTTPNVQIEKFAKTVKEGCHAMLGLVNAHGAPLAHDHFEERKNEPLPEFGGFSPRDTYIWYSEEVMKPRFGNDIFGRLTADRIAQSHMPIVCISDSGFIEEAQVLIDRFGSDNVSLVRMHRTDHDFTGDSRSYIDSDQIPVRELRNDGDLSTLTYNLAHVLQSVGFEVRRDYGDV